MCRWTVLFLLFLLFSQSSAEFNGHFADFVEENYGTTFLDALQRTELGDNGSFGGKNTADEKIERDPVIFVHGISDIAGGKMHALAAKFRKHGYKSGELYGTTYADGNKNNPLSWTDYSMKCEHVKQIRTLILAVRYYTLRDVDIISYSLGVPIARKAILGGTCVDTKEDLGSPLTNYIDSFIGIGGPNHGIAFQIAGISIPGCVIGAIPILPICSKVIGLYSGFCPTESQFLTDINDRDHYEGRYVYSIYSRSDNWIGYEVCGQITAKIPAEDGHKSYKKYSHDEILDKTYEMQIQMIQNHTSLEEFDTLLQNSTISRRKALFNENGKSEKVSKKFSRITSEEDESIENRNSNPRAHKRNVKEYDYNDVIITPMDSKAKRARIRVAESYTPKENMSSKNANNKESGKILDTSKNWKRGPPSISPDSYYATSTLSPPYISNLKTSEFPKVPSTTSMTTTTVRSTTTRAQIEQKIYESYSVTPLFTPEINRKTHDEIYGNRKNEEGYHTHVRILLD